MNMYRKPSKFGKGHFVVSFIIFSFSLGTYLGFNTFAEWLYLGDSSQTQLDSNFGQVKGVNTEITELIDPQVDTKTGSVKAVEDEITDNSLVFRLKVFFFDSIQAVSGVFDTNLEVGNDLLVGNAVEVINTLTVGENLVVSGELVAPNTIYSVTAGTGIAVSGDQDITITNDDLGSSQEIFKNFKFNDDTISAGDNDDTINFESGTGISFSTSGDTVTVAASSADLNISGWDDSGTTISLTTSTDNVGIGTTTANYKLHVVGTGNVTGATTLQSTLGVTGLSTLSGGATISSGLNNSSGGITNAGSITGATGLTSSGTVTFSSFSTGILHSNVNGVVSSSALNLAGGGTEVSGALPATNGGTGLTAVATGDILYASASNTLSALGAGSEGEVLTISSGVPAWGVASGSSPCATCLVNNPGSTQTITPAASTATGLVIKQALSGLVDVFRIESNDGSNTFFKIDSSGNVTLGSQTSSGVFTVSPLSTDPISISPVAQGAGQYTGTITSSDLTAIRTWTFPDETGIVCLSTGNCSGTAAAVGGSGTVNYITKWSSTFGVTDSILYDDGTNVGIGSTTPGAKLDVVGTFKTTGLATLGDDLLVTAHATISGSLRADQAVDFNDILGVSGATTLGSTLDVTGLSTFGGNVGIGSLTPGYKLDLVGEFNLTDAIRVAGDAGSSGYLLTSSAGGANTWTNPDSLTNSGWWTNTSNVLHAKNEYAAITDLVLGGNSTASASIHLQSNGQAYFTGNVGIGTTSPTKTLDIDGSVEGWYFEANNSGFRFDGDNDTGLIRLNENQLALEAGGTNFLSIVNDVQNIVTIGDSLDTDINLDGNLFIEGSSGNVGIGTSVASGRLAVDGGGIKLLDPGEGITFGNSQEFWISDGARSMAMQSRGGVNFYINSNNSLAETLEDFNIFADVAEGGGTTPLFTVKQGGNVGIGTTDPGAELNLASGSFKIGTYDCNNSFCLDGSGIHTGWNYTITNHNGGHLLLMPDGNVGIGTTSPTYKLDVAGDIGLDTRLYHNDDPDTVLVFGEDQIELQTGGVRFLTLKEGTNDIATGNLNRADIDFSWNGDTNYNLFYLDAANETVGIGTSTPVGKFDVQGAITGKALTILNETGDQNIFVASASGTNRFVIQNDGNVGIGSTSPTVELDVAGSLRLNDGSFSAPSLTFRTNSTAGFYEVPTGGGYVAYASGSQDRFYFASNYISARDTGAFYLLRAPGSSTTPTYSFVGDIDTGMSRAAVDEISLITAGAEQVRINANGNVGIGSTIPGLALDVVGSARFSAVTSGAYSADLNLTSDGTLTTAASDIRLKENFAELSDTEVLNKILDLKTYTFNWKDGGSYDIGMIAQEVEQIFPEITFTNKVDGYMGINYSRLPTLLVSALQQQQKTIDSMYEEINANNSEASSSAITNKVETENSELPTISDLLVNYTTLTDTVWTFTKEVIFNAKTKFLASVEFVKEVTFKGSVRFSKENAGTVTIASGVTKVKVSFDKTFVQIPNIYLTNKNILEGNISISEIEKDYFVLELSQANSSDIEVQWLAILADKTDSTRVEVLESQQVVEEPILTDESDTILNLDSSSTPTPEPILEPSIEPTPEPTVEPTPTATPEPGQTETSTNQEEATTSAEVTVINE